MPHTRPRVPELPDSPDPEQRNAANVSTAAATSTSASSPATRAPAAGRFTEIPISERSALILYRGVRPAVSEIPLGTGRSGGALLAASYERKSKTDPFGIEEQYHVNSAKAAQEGYTVPNTEQFRFSDDDWTGTTSRRPGFERLMATVLNGSAPFTRIYVKDRSRWGRWKDPRMHHHLEVDLEQHNVRLRYCDERDIAFDSASDEDMISAALLGLIGSMRASQERAQLIKRTQGGIRHRVLMGFYPGTMAPYGTERVLAKKLNGEELHPVATTEFGLMRRPDCNFRLRWASDGSVDQVLDIFQRFDAGQSLSGIARQLNADGVRCPLRLHLEARAHHPRPARQTAPRLRKLGPPCQLWTINSVRSILTNPIYIGTLVWGMRRLAAGETPAKRGEAHSNGSAPLVLEDFMTAPPISRELWTAVQRRLLENARTRRSRAADASPFLLSGLLRCATCGAPLYGFTKRERKGTRYYRHDPSGRTGTARSTCPHRHRYQRADSVETCVNSAAAQMLAPQVLRNLAAKELKRFLKERSSQRKLQEHARLEAQLADLEEEGKNAARNAARAKSEDARETLLVVVHETAERSGAIKQQLAAIGRETARLAAVRAELETRVVEELDLPSRFVAMTTAAQKHVLRALAESVNLSFESAEIEVRARALPLLPAACMPEEDAGPIPGAA